MTKLILRKFNVLYWGFDYGKRAPFKNYLFTDDNAARKWLAQQGVAREVNLDEYLLCDCGTCDHCTGNHIHRALTHG